MKIEELHEILKKKYKRYVSSIEDGFRGIGSSYKEFFITKKNLTISIIQVGKKIFFEFYIQDNIIGEGCTISTKMDGSKVIDLVNLIM